MENVEWTRPARDELLRAIDAYLAVAYAAGAVPQVVVARVAPLRTAELIDFDQKPFEREPRDGPPVRYFLRLGNAKYPHMKLVIDRAPDDVGHLFRADTHDRHVRPPAGSRDAEAFEQLMVANQRYAEQIDEAWNSVGLPTFKGFLRADLARRRAHQ